MMSIAFRVFLACCLFGFVYSNSIPSIDSLNGMKEFSMRAIRNATDDEEEVDQIVGGTAAAKGEFPHKVNLISRGYFFCGGTLISPTHVLTAGHCLEGKRIDASNSIAVVANSLRTHGGDVGAQVEFVKKFVIHPQYKTISIPNVGSYADFDVALILLRNPISNIALARLPAAGSTDTYAGKSAVIAGNGETYRGSGIPKNAPLLKTTVNVVSNAVCKSLLNNDIPINNNMLCAQGQSKAVCSGDSGGPIFVDGVQVGVTSFTECNSLSVFARITAFLPWIRATQNSIQMRQGE